MSEPQIGAGNNRAGSQKRIGVCIIVENNTVPPDRRVWREARTLSEAGYSVTVICPKGRGFESSHETIDGIEIYRHAAYSGSGAFGYVIEYAWALLIEFLLALRVYLRTPFRILQACNPPDTIFLIALFFKLFGVRFIFDQHDPFPEFFEARFQRKGFFYRIVCLAERLTFRVSDVTIVTNSSCREMAMTRGGVPADHCFIVRNCPSVKDFPQRPAQSELKQGRAHLVVYVGIMGSQDGIEQLVDSIDYLVNRKGRKDTLFALIGPGSEVEVQKARATKLGLDPWVKFTGPLYGDDLRAYLATADVGVSPDPPNLFNDKITMIKIFEYMACGIPVVHYDLAESRRSSEGAGLYAAGGDPVAFAEQIDRLLEDESLRRTLGAVGRKRVQDGLNWEVEKQILLKAYDAVYVPAAGAAVVPSQQI